MKILKLLILLISVLFFSCHSTQYSHSYETGSPAVDFSSGKWMLNTIDAPINAKKGMTKIAVKELNDFLGQRFQNANDLKGLALTYVPLDPNKFILAQLAKEAKVQFFINIKSEIVKEEAGNIRIGGNYGLEQNIASTTMQVYDLNAAEIIYTQTVTGKVSVDEDDKADLSFAKGVNGIMVGSLKRIFKNIRKGY